MNRRDTRFLLLLLCVLAVLAGALVWGIVTCGR
jgi:hypothetical protein